MVQAPFGVNNNGVKKLNGLYINEVVFHLFLYNKSAFFMLNPSNLIKSK